MNNKILLSIILCFSSACPLFAQDGTLDSSFGINGKRISELNVSESSVNSMAIQTDGKILLAGYSTIYPPAPIKQNFSVARYNIDGSNDTTFGNNGRVVTRVTNENSIARSIIVQPDGKILVGGNTEGPGRIDFMIVRYNSNGTFDSSFNKTGVKIIPMSKFSTYGYSLALQNDKKILIAGHSYWADYDFAISRIFENGRLDSSFNDSGKVLLKLGTSDDIATSVKIQKNGKIIVSGYTASNNYNSAIVRLNTNGKLDNTFGNNGIVIKDLSNNGNDFTIASAIQQDDKIILAGFVGNSSNDRALLSRFKSNGELDSSFNKTGSVITKLPGDQVSIYDVKIQGDNKIVIAGYAGFSPDASFIAVRYLNNGNIDSTFGNNGIAETKISTRMDWAGSLGIQKDGKIVLGGTCYCNASYSFAMVRYNSKLVLSNLDLRNKNKSMLLYPNPITKSALLEYDLIENGLINLYLSDINGKTLVNFLKDEFQYSGTHKQNVIIPDNITPGIYFLNFTSLDVNYVIKVIVE
jgi:uncharacterized delta-60 repeat protein